MPRIEPYGQRVREQPLRLPRQRPAPSGVEEFGQTLTRVGVALANEADRARDEMKKRAYDTRMVTAEQQFNQLNTIGWHSKDRGPEGQDVKGVRAKGILTMTGNEPQEMYEENVEWWELQADEIVKAAKTPEERIGLERMRNDQRDRYVNTSRMHARSELAKYETGQTNALLKSSVEIAGVSADQPGGLEIINEQLGRQREIVEQYGHTIGLHSQAAKELYIAQLRSETHVLAINRLITADKDVEAEAYFKRVTEKTALFPDGQMFESHAGPLREKVQASSIDGAADRVARAAWAKHGPKAGEDKTTINDDVIMEEARTMTEGLPNATKVYERARSFLNERIADTQRGRQNRTNATKNALYDGWINRVPLSQLRLTPAWKEADEELRKHITTEYEQREAQERAEARAAAGLQITQFNQQQALREMNGHALYVELSEPSRLLAMKSRDDLKPYAPQLSNQQYLDLVKKWDEIHAGAPGYSSVTVDWEMFTSEARETGGIEYAMNPRTTWSKPQAARMGQLLAAVERAVQAQENAIFQKTAKRRRLDVDEQRAIVQSILKQKVMVEGFFTNTEYPLAMVQTDELGSIFVPFDKIHPDLQKVLRDEVKKQPAKAGRKPPNQLSDKDIYVHFKEAMQKAYAHYLNGEPYSEWSAYIAQAVREW